MLASTSVATIVPTGAPMPLSSSTSSTTPLNAATGASGTSATFTMMVSLALSVPSDTVTSNSYDGPVSWSRLAFLTVITPVTASMANVFSLTGRLNRSTAPASTSVAATAPPTTVPTPTFSLTERSAREEALSTGASLTSTMVMDNVAVEATPKGSVAVTDSWYRLVASKFSAPVTVT